MTTNKPYYVRSHTLHLDDDFYVVMVAPREGSEPGTLQMGGPIAYTDSEQNAISLANILCEHEARYVPEPNTIHAEIAEQVELARTYAEDGAFHSAAKIFEQLWVKVQNRAYEIDDALNAATQKD